MVVAMVEGDSPIDIVAGTVVAVLRPERTLVHDLFGPAGNKVVGRVCINPVGTAVDADLNGIIPGATERLY